MKKTYFDTIDDALIGRIEGYLASKMTAERRAWAAKIYNSKYNVIGGYMADMKAIARRIVAEHKAEEFLSGSYRSSLEIVMIDGLVICYDKMDEERTLSRLDNYLYMADNWAHIDTIVTALKTTSKAYYSFLVALLNRDNEWHIRYGIVGLMERYMNSDNVADILHMITNISRHTYYIDMAISWAIAEAYAKNKADTIGIVREHCLNSDILNMSLRKVKDSYKISQGDKHYFARVVQEEKARL